MKHEKDFKKRQRLQALYLAASGHARHRQTIATLVGVHRHSVAAWFAAYAQGGLEQALHYRVSTPPERRVLVIDPSFFDAGQGFNKMGVLRHELGHVLGFRHEHIRSEAPPGCPGESLFGTIVATDYDPKSVMHYFCGDVGSKQLEITDLDRQGAQRLYGLPLSSFQFVE